MEITRGVIKGAQKVVVYGPEGIGKSTFASKFPNPVFIDTEGSTKQLDVARTPKPSSWTMLLEQVAHFAAHPDKCSTLVIDTADWAERLCVEHICAKAQKDGLEGFGYGKGYMYLAEEFGRLLDALEKVTERGIHVVLLAHAKITRFEQPDEIGSYDRWELKLQKHTAPLVKEWADMILFANFKHMVINVDDQGAQKGKNKVQGGKRMMYAEHHPCWDAKNRHGLKEEMPFSYADVAHCFGGEVPASPAPPVATVPPAAPAAPTPQPEPEQPAEQMQLDAATPPEGKTFSGEWPPAEDTVPPVPEGVPKNLADLMVQSKVSEEEVRKVVAAKGYYPVDTPISAYAMEFIDGWIVVHWSKVVEYIEDEIRDLPF